MGNQQNETKARFTIKKALYGLSIAFIALLIGVMTLADANFDPAKFDFYKWLVKTIILLAIEIPSIIIGESWSTDFNKDSPNGKFQRSTDRFHKAFEAIQPIHLHFRQFFFWFRNQENFRLRVEALERSDFDGLEAVYIVRYVTKDDLSTLKDKPIKKVTNGGKEIIIRQFGDEEVGYTGKTKTQIVKEMLNGKFDTSNDSYSYFLFADSKRSKSNSIVDEGLETETEIVRDKASNRIYKILVGIIFSLIWAMLAWESVEQGINNPNTWVNLVVRLATMFGGLLSGWMTGAHVTKLMSRVLDVKSSMLELFRQSYDKGEFVPKSYEEMAIEAWEEKGE